MGISGVRRPPVWAWCVGLALVSSAVSGALFLLAIDGHLSEIFYVECLVGQAPGNAELLRWALILDMLGYYVLLAPLFVAVGRRLFDLGEQGAALWTIGALMYVTAGSVAAMALAYGVPPILHGYAQSIQLGTAGVRSRAHRLGEAAVRGVWQTFDPIGTGAWAVASGLALGRLGRRFLGTVGTWLNFLRCHGRLGPCPANLCRVDCTPQCNGSYVGGGRRASIHGRRASHRPRTRGGDTRLGPGRPRSGGVCGLIGPGRRA
jgi:hypothetical protein